MGDKCRQKKLLIIEDDTFISQIMEYILCGEGYNVVLSETGAETEDLSAINPDLILLDVWLYGQAIHGAEICTRLKSQPATRHIPVILLSARRDIKQVSMDCGADEYLNKPFDIDNLTGMVKRLAPM